MRDFTTSLYMFISSSLKPSWDLIWVRYAYRVVSPRSSIRYISLIEPSAKIPGTGSWLPEKALENSRNALFSFRSGLKTPMAPFCDPSILKYSLFEPEGGSAWKRMALSPAHFSKSVINICFLSVLHFLWCVYYCGSQ